MPFGLYPSMGSSAPAAPSADATMRAINDACRRRGLSYSCKQVSWDDSSRGCGAGGGLSCWGPNITDTYLKAKGGMMLFTVRPDNWDEKLGTVSSSEIAVVAGGKPPQPGPCVPWSPPASESLSPITLCDLLKSMGRHGAYAGLPASCDLSSDTLDSQCSVRFQATFLPTRTNGTFGSNSGRESLEFATEAYNYQTTSDDDPKNLVLLCTTQGVAVQQDGSAATRLYHHHVDSTGRIHRHWLEAERTTHGVGGPQVETEAEKADALARGKATSSVIGPRELGTRFNVLMTVQVPLRQTTKPPGGLFGGPPPPVAFSYGSACEEQSQPPTPALVSAFFGSPPPFSAAPPAPPCAPPPGGSAQFAGGFCCSASDPNLSARYSASAPVNLSAPFKPKTGSSNAARVSIGTEHDVWPGLRGKARSPQRHESEHLTITIVLYNVVVGGVPSEDDVIAAIDDLEQLYRACRAVSRKDAGYANAQFPSAVANVAPTPSPNPPAVSNHASFPSPQVSNHASFPSPQPPPTTNGSPFSSLKSLAPFQDVPRGLLDQICTMPLSYETFRYVHDLGLERLSRQFATQATLSDAFGLFRFADEVHVQLYGRPASSALYNLACVCSRLSVRVSSDSVVPANNLPKCLTSDASACLDASAAWLCAAAAAGFTDHGRMKADVDLAELRARCPTQFEMAVQISQAVAEGWCRRF